MGVVYRAQDLMLERQVALKLLPAEQTFDLDRRRRFLREAKSAAAVTHPCIASVYEVGVDEAGTIFIAMELIAGRTLRTVMKQGLLPRAEALRIALDIARGLARAHEAGVVHRDVKPDNVMLDDEGHVKILDFGLAKLREPEGDREPEVEDRASTGMRVVGTPEYMSPEQALGGGAGPEGDVFSLGIVMFEMLSGKRPFTGPTPLAVIASILRDDAPRLVEVPDEIADLVATCLDKDTTRRPRDARAVSRTLGMLLGGSGSIAAGPRSSDDLALLPTLGEAELAATQTLDEQPKTVSLRRGEVAEAPHARASDSRAVAEPRTSRGIWIALGIVFVAGLGGLAFWPGPSRPRSEPNGVPTPVDDEPDDGAEVVAPIEVQLGNREIRDLSVSLSDVGSGTRLALATGDAVVIVELASPTPFERRIELGEGSVSRVSLVGGRDEVLAIAIDRQGGETWVFRVPLDGGQPTRLFRARAAVASPRGDEIAYTTTDRDADCQVRLRSADGRDRVLHEGGCGSGVLAWAREGDVLGFVETSDDASVPAQVRLLDRDGASRVILRTPRLLLQTAAAPIAFLPDGCLAVFLARPPPAHGSTLHRVCRDTTDVERIEPPIATFEQGSAQALGFDREGRALALLMSSQADVAVAPIDAEGAIGELAVVTHDSHEDRDATWADDRSLVLHSDRDGRFALYRVELDRDQSTPIMPSPDHATYPVVHGDALFYFRTAIAAEGATVTTVLHRVGLDGSDDTEQRPPIEIAFFAAGKPSPRTLQVACGGDRCALGAQTNGGFHIEPLSGDAPTIDVSGSVGSFAIAPDGEHIAVAREDALVLVDRSGREQRMLVEGSFHGVAFHPDGRRLYATATGGAPFFRVLGVDLETGAARVVLSAADTWYGAPSISPDGTRIALSVKHFEPSVWSMPLPSARVAR